MPPEIISAIKGFSLKTLQGFLASGKGLRFTSRDGSTVEIVEIIEVNMVFPSKFTGVLQVTTEKGKFSFKLTEAGGAYSEDFFVIGGVEYRAAIVKLADTLAVVVYALPIVSEKTLSETIMDALTEPPEPVYTPKTQVPEDGIVAWMKGWEDFKKTVINVDSFTKDLLWTPFRWFKLEDGVYLRVEDGGEQMLRILYKSSRNFEIRMGSFPHRLIFYAIPITEKDFNRVLNQINERTARLYN